MKFLNFYYFFFILILSPNLLFRYRRGYWGSKKFGEDFWGGGLEISNKDFGQHVQTLGFIVNITPPRREDSSNWFKGFLWGKKNYLFS
ncbi:MAG: hypothetical protein CM15mP75_7750 [Flammeovirgaceae bacterium]|nr:MAG: hypothetical protein CM15mP75_7750 [Flammeovirgaceae bacterium]